MACFNLMLATLLILVIFDISNLLKGREISTLYTSYRIISQRKKVGNIMKSHDIELQVQYSIYRGYYIHSHVLLNLYRGSYMSVHVLLNLHRDYHMTAYVFFQFI